MKHFLLTMLLAFIGFATAFAGDDIKLSEGSIVPLKDGGVASLIINMEDARFDNKKPLHHDDRFINYEEWLPECALEFIREFNDNTKKFTMTINADDAQYEIIVKISNVDTFLNMMSFKGGVGIKLWGNITIKNKVNGENVAVFIIDEESNSGLTYQIALEEGFEGIAKYLAKRIKKGK